MRIPCDWSIALVLLGVAACAGVSARPEAVSPDSLPSVELSPAAIGRRDTLVENCVTAAVVRRFEEAERDARSALLIDPRCARARAVVGMALLERARAQEPMDLHLANAGDAETLLAERLAPADPFVGWMRAVFLAESGHVSAAAAAAEAALSRTVGARPEERAPLFGVAGTYRYELGEERAALPLLQAYIEIRSDDAAASFRIGSCLLRKAAVPSGANPEKSARIDAEAAARAFQRCCELAPGDEDAALAAGAATMRAAELAEKQGETAIRDARWSEAAAHFTAVSTRFPDSAEAKFRLGVVAEARDVVAEARAAYTQALDRDPQHLGALLNLAALLDGTEDAAQVVPLLQRALQADAARPGLTARERRRIEERVAAVPDK